MNKVFLLTLIFIACSIIHSHESDVVFDDARVLRFSLTFDQPDYLDILWANYLAANNEYIPATFTFGEEVYDSVGVRYKGNASAFAVDRKKPFKIKFNEYIETQEFHGISKLSLSNQYGDPSFLREKYLYDVFNKYVPSGRANHVKMYINDDYLGLYTNVEQVDSRMMKRLFGNNEAGNLFKGDPRGTLEWLGSDPALYYPWYELKTNEEINDWSDLVNFIDVLNNTGLATYEQEMGVIFQMYPWLCTQAINNLFVNFDSYIGKGHNYYLYHRSDNDKFIHIPWDLNYSFGTYGGGTYTHSANESIYYEGDFPDGRLLSERIYDIQILEELYFMVYKYLFENEFDTEVIYPRITELAGTIRSAVYSDPNKQYTNEEFELSLTDDVGNVYGLESFIEQRRVSIQAEFDELLFMKRNDDIFLNEFLANNNSFNTDEFGEYDDWIELYNNATEEIDISGMFLTDNSDYPAKWRIPDGTLLAAGERLIVWADEQPEQGDYHADFKLNEDGEFVGLYCKDGVIPADTLSFENQTSNMSFGRYPEGTGEWQVMVSPTPGTANTPGNYPPNISNHDQYPLLPESTGDVNVTAAIWDDVSIVSARLYYDTGSGYTELSMRDNGLNGDGVSGDGIYGCYIPALAGGTNVQYYLEATDDQAVTGRFPDDPLLVEYESDYSPPMLVINEFLAANSTVNHDEQGEYDDWIELYNAGVTSVDIGGMYLADDLGNLDSWYQIPGTDSEATTIDPGEFLLLWADNEINDGILHLDFRLDAANEEIGIFSFFGTSPVDTLSYGVQTIDTSYGRTTDGAGTWTYFSTPTPGISNTGVFSPENVSLTLSGGNVNIVWDAVTGASFYSVYSSSDPYGTFSLEETSIVITNWSEPVGTGQKFYHIKAGN